MIKWIDDPALDLENQRVFCRVDFNVPMNDDGTIADNSRIMAVLPTIQCLIDKKARIVLASHLGRPKGKARKSLSLEPVAEYLSGMLDKEVIFVEDCIGDGVKRLVTDLTPGAILMLENLRFHSGEEKNEESFSRLLAQNADVYVDDAFGAMHRAHASTEGMTHFIQRRYAGLLVRQEIEALRRVSRSPKRPFIAVLGGAKVSDKLGVIAHLLSRVDTIVIGGAMAYTFMKAAGQEIGLSRFEEDRLLIAKSILQKAKQSGVEIVLPVDHVVMNVFDAASSTRIVSRMDADDIGVDIGPESMKLFAEKIPQTGTVFWNGPMGVFEWP
ncbi:MAG: phosphoglycerate kinase, partial [Methylococcaceae bacterium]|nr:phosphoglycerate kinase [Methylococcaceae bacterium]